MNHQLELLPSLNDLPFCCANVSIIAPERKNLMPANSILLPVISGVIANAANPNLMRGYAQPQTVAAVSAKKATHIGL